MKLTFKIKEYEDNIKKMNEERENVEMRITDELLEKEETVSLLLKGNNLFRKNAKT